MTSPDRSPHRLRDVSPGDRQAVPNDLSRRGQLVAAIGRLMPSLHRRRAELAADEAAVTAMLDELVMIERGAVPAAAAREHLSLDEAAGLAGCTRATMRKHALKHGFGWKSGGRWRISREGLRAFLSKSQEN